MKLLVTALALSVLAIPLAPAQIQLRDIAAETAQSKTPHIYKLGEHLSEAYGSYEIVDDWRRVQLTPPPGGHHWVRYGGNYLLVTATDGLIKRIVRAS